MTSVKRRSERGESEDAGVDAVDVAELGRAVKRLNTGSGRGGGGGADARAASAYAEVNAMLRMLHFERVRRRGVVGGGEGDGYDGGGEGGG